MEGLRVSASRGPARVDVKSAGPVTVHAAVLTPSGTRANAPSGSVRLQRAQSREQAQHRGPVRQGQWQPRPSPQPVPDGAAIMSDIKATRHVAELVRVHAHYAPYLNARHVSAIITHLAQLAAQTPQPGDTDDTDHQRARSHEQASTSEPAPTRSQSAGQRGQSASAQARQVRGASPAPHQGPSQSQLLTHLLRIMAANISQFSFRQLANCTWAVAKLDAPVPSAWVQRCLAACCQRLAEAKPQEISNLLYGLALRPEWLDGATSRGVGSRDEWLKQVLARSQELVSDYRPQELSNLLWAAGTLHTHRRLPHSTAHSLSLALQQAAVLASQLKGQEVSNVLWAAGKLTGQPGLIGAASPSQPKPGALLPRCSHSTLQPLLTQAAALAPAMNPQGAATTLLAIAWLGVRPPLPWVHQLLASTTPQLPQYKPTELVNTIQALAYMGYPPEIGWYSGWLRCARRQLGGFTCQHLAAAAWALRRMGTSVPAVFVAMLRLHCADRMCEFSGSELKQLALTWDADYCRPDEAWLRLYTSAVYDQTPHLSCEDLSHILSRLAALNHRPPTPWLTHTLTRFSHTAEDASAATLSRTLYALGELGVVPDEAWCERVMGVVQGQLHRANVLDVSSLVWGVAVLGLKPGWQWVAAVTQRCTVLLRAHVAIVRDLAPTTATNPTTNPTHAPTQPQSQPQVAARTASQGPSTEDDSEESLLTATWADADMAAGPPGYEALLHRSTRGGSISQRTVALSCRYLWTPDTIQRTVWAFTRLGTQASEPVMQLLREAEGLSDVRTLPADAQQQALARMHAALVRAADAAAKQRPAAAAVPPPAAPAQEPAVVAEQADRGLFVLEGMLQWAMRRFGYTEGSNAEHNSTEEYSVSAELGDTHVQLDDSEAEVSVPQPASVSA